MISSARTGNFKHDRSIVCRTINAMAVFLIACSGAAHSFELTSATIADINQAFDEGILDSEKLVQLSLARISAYDDEGPGINAVIILNPAAIDTARSLDEERRKSGPRSSLHGIPVVLKDNIDTADMPTTAGSFMLRDAQPPDDAFLVTRLRDAGAIILAKVNMSEFASGDAMSSLGGATYNPHDPARTPSGSSGGTGAAIAAAYATIGLGTDTGGSVRGPSAANGIVGLKPTHGLLSRDGIVPLALSFDTAGPMARNVYDVAVTLGILSGVDDADAATRKSAGLFRDDYTSGLNVNALDGARIGVARDFMESDEEVDWIIEAALESMRNAGAEVIDVELPEWLLDSRGEFYRAIRYREFKAQIADYLATTAARYPKSLDDLISESMTVTARNSNGVIPNPGRWRLMLNENESGQLTDYEYLAVRDHALPLIRDVISGLMAAENLDTIVYPTSPERPSRIDPDPDPDGAPGSGGSAVILANLTGFPDLIVPAGFTGRGLPVAISFLGKPFDEATLLSLGYAFEQRTSARRLPVTTPALPAETIAERR